MGRKIFALTVTLAFFYITSPLLFPIAMGGILATLFLPLLDDFEKKGMSRIWSTCLLTLGATILIILPTSVLVFYAAKTSFLQLQAWRLSPTSNQNLVDGLLSQPTIQHLMVWLNGFTPIEVTDFTRGAHDLAANVGGRLAELFGGVLTQIPGMILSLLFMVLSLYFFLLDGRKLLIFVRRNSFFNPVQTDLLLMRISEMCRSVVLAALVSGGLQAIIEVFGCAITGTPNLAFIGLLVFISSFVPLVGSLPVTVGVALQQIVAGRKIEGVILLIIGFIIFGMDNAVRSLFLRGSANLHPFLAFVAAIGGLQTMGFVGVFIGPICAALFLATLQIVTQTELKAIIPPESK